MNVLPPRHCVALFNSSKVTLTRPILSTSSSDYNEATTHITIVVVAIALHQAGEHVRRLWPVQRQDDVPGEGAQHLVDPERNDQDQHHLT